MDGMGLGWYMLLKTIMLYFFSINVSNKTSKGNEAHRYPQHIWFCRHPSHGIDPLMTLNTEKTELIFGATAATGGRVKFLSAA